jgi:hypothetical protein
MDARVQGPDPLAETEKTGPRAEDAKDAEERLPWEPNLYGS